MTHGEAWDAVSNLDARGRNGQILALSVATAATQVWCEEGYLKTLSRRTVLHCTFSDDGLATEKGGRTSCSLAINLHVFLALY